MALEAEKAAMELDAGHEEREEGPQVDGEDWRQHIPRHCVPIRADVRTFDWKALPPCPRPCPSPQACKTEGNKDGMLAWQG